MYLQTGATALFVAAEGGHLKVVEMLIAAKSQVDVQEEVSVSIFCCHMEPCASECIIVKTL